MPELYIERTITIVNPERIKFKAETSCSGGWIHLEVYIDNIHFGNLYPSGHWAQNDFTPPLRLIEVPLLGWGFVDIGRRLESFLAVEKMRKENSTK